MFGTVKEGLIGRHLTFVPLRDVTLSPEFVRTTVAKAQVKDAPNLAGDDLSALDEESLYRHYGLDYASPSTPSGRAPRPPLTARRRRPGRQTSTQVPPVADEVMTASVSSGGSAARPGRSAGLRPEPHRRSARRCHATTR